MTPLWLGTTRQRNKFSAPVDPVVQQPHISSTSTSTPSRKPSIKSSASTRNKSSGVCSISGTPATHATVLQAGGENPSGTLVPYPGWDAQAQPPLGGSLSRHTSFGSSASAPAAAAAGGRGKPTVWG